MYMCVYIYVNLGDYTLKYSQYLSLGGIDDFYFSFLLRCNFYFIYKQLAM